MRLNELKKKKVLILGFGKEGRDSFQFLRKLFPNKTLGVADVAIISLLQNQKPKTKNQKLIKEDKNVRWHLGEGYLQAIKNYDVIIKSPGVLPHLSEVEAAFKQKKITSATEIFFENCPGIIIGVTGTKGKGTTATLIYEILKQAGLKVKLVGNIGKPCLCYWSNWSNKSNGSRWIFVYELSSHQLYNLKKSPHIAVFLNLYPDHLDYYRNSKEYQRAKENITRHQRKDDFFIYNADDKIVRGIAKKTKAKKIPFSFKSKNSEITTIPRSLSKCYPLKGDFNLANLAAAVSVAKIFKIPFSKIKRAIRNFKSSPHRLEKVGEYKGIEFYNDSAATIPEATSQAIEALGPRLQTIILGGSEKGSDYKELAKKIWQSKIKNIILFPATGEKILLEITSRCARPSVAHFFVKSMKEAVELVFEHTSKGKICLLSPASASFTLFRDYRQRGDLFKRYIKDLNSKSQILRSDPVGILRDPRGTSHK